jgi:hypothetical protein
MRYVYVVVDGTPRGPKGYVGTYSTKQEALNARFKLCRMGGFIKREKVEVKQ